MRKARFSNKTLLFVTHQTHNKSGNHGIKSPLRVSVITNQCINCSSTLADRSTAQNHVVNSWTKGVDMPSLPDNPEPRIHQEGRQLRRTVSRTKQREGGASGSTTVFPKPKGTANSSSRVSTRPCLRPSSRRIRRRQTYPGHTSDQGVEPRSGQNAETDADLRRKGAARGARTHPRTTIRGGKSGPDQVSSAEFQHGRQTWARLEPLSPTQIFDEVRFCRLDKTYRADINISTLSIVSPEKRLLVLEAFGQTEAERKYGRSPPTAMERELLEDLLKR